MTEEKWRLTKAAAAELVRFNFLHDILSSSGLHSLGLGVGRTLTTAGIGAFATVFLAKDEDSGILRAYKTVLIKNKVQGAAFDYEVGMMEYLNGLSVSQPILNVTHRASLCPKMFSHGVLQCILEEGKPRLLLVGYIEMEVFETTFFHELVSVMDDVKRYGEESRERHVASASHKISGLMRVIGAFGGALYETKIVHGDMRLANIMMRRMPRPWPAAQANDPYASSEFVLIDFGRSGRVVSIPGEGGVSTDEVLRYPGADITETRYDRSRDISLVIFDLNISLYRGGLPELRRNVGSTMALEAFEELLEVEKHRDKHLWPHLRRSGVSDFEAVRYEFINQAFALRV